MQSFTKDFGPCWQRAAGAFKIYFASWVVVGRAVVSNGKKSVDDSTRRQGGEGGKLAFDIHVYFHVKCRSPLQWWYHAPQNIHRRLKWSQLGRHFIVNLLLLFVRLTALHRRCRDWQNTFCRLLTLTCRSWCGFSFYLILHMWRTLALVGSEQQVRLDLFCEVQEIMGGGRQDGGFKRWERRRWLLTTTTRRRGQISIWYTCIFSCTMQISRQLMT